MDRLFGILPVRKSELVIGRYVFVLAMGLLSLIISLIAQPLVLKVLGETVGVFDIVTAAIAGVFLFALYTVFQIPGYYKYGSIKGLYFFSRKCQLSGTQLFQALNLLRYFLF